MEWIENVSSEAKVAFLLTLTEKIMHKIENYKWYGLTRRTMDMCWEWLEEKKHSGDELYLKIDNDVDGLAHIKGVAFVDDQPDPQEKALWFCVTQAAFYVTWQAYEYEEEEYVPQAIEMTDDEVIDWFMEKIVKVDGYQEEWAERLREYLLKNHPAGSDKKIKREELLNLIA
ncbi:Imm6 family immunity protein [Thermoactinomyces sp. FSL K6-2592]|uniref:Imm6 family immunity protein n=1 Tax=Thermoactinomyces sp. FSL K6-2592 TaxID=2975347 RepID=UPI0030F5EFA5